jgi:hypothetical protein
MTMKLSIDAETLNDRLNNHVQKRIKMHTKLIEKYAHVWTKKIESLFKDEIKKRYVFDQTPLTVYISLLALGILAEHTFKREDAAFFLSRFEEENRGFSTEIIRCSEGCDIPCERDKCNGSMIKIFCTALDTVS